MLLGVLLAVAVGLVLQILSAASDPDPTSPLAALQGRGGYLSESAAPYILVPFAVGVLARSRTGAAVGGVLACWLLVSAYYGWFIPHTIAAEHGGLREQIFWIVAAIGAGSAGAVLGQGVLRPGWPRYLMPLALVLEPVAWLVLLRLGIAPVLAQPQKAVGAAVEAAIGLVWLLLLIRAHLRVRTTQAVRAG